MAEGSAASGIDFALAAYREDGTWLVASLPASGSERQKEPTHSPVASFGKYFAFCSSLPNA